MSAAAEKNVKNQQAWLGGLVKGLIVFFSWLPLSLNQAVGRTIGRLLWWLPNSNRRTTLQNLAVAMPDLSQQQRNQLAKQSLLHLGMMATELGPAWRWSQQQIAPLITEVKGQALLDQALAQNRGILFLTPHIGSWEMLAPYLSWHYPATFLYRPPNIAAVESFMVKSRGRFGAQLAPTDVRGVRTLIKALKQQQVTLILPDQDPGEKGGLHAPFFGFPARTMTLASKLIQKTEAVPLFMMLERLPKARGYCVHILPAEQAIGSADEKLATAALNRGIEACVSTLPEQYLWSYKRYRKPPSGYENIYKSVK